jgi:hypothetical protein
MPRKLLVFAVIALFSLPTYAIAGSCCCQPEKNQTQSQDSGSKDQSCCPAPAAASGASGCPSKAEASKKKAPDQALSQESKKYEPEKN